MNTGSQGLFHFHCGFSDDAYFDKKTEIYIVIHLH